MRFVNDPDGVPDFVEARDDVIDQVVLFARALRHAGAQVPANASIDAVRALVEIGFNDREQARAALRSVLISRKEDLPTFDRMFPAFWQRLVDTSDDHYAPEQGAQAPVPGFGAPDRDGAGGDGADNGGPEDVSEPIETRIQAAGEAGGEGDESDDETAGETATASVYSPSGRSEPIGIEPTMFGGDENLDRALRQLTRAIAGLRGRRWRRSGEERLDARRALRRSFGTGGTVMSVPQRGRKRTAVKALLLVDVSQSVLDTIDRGFLVRFLRRAREEWRNARIFFFDTSVREVTSQFDESTPQAAITALERAEAEWGGGTRIGHSIESIRRTHPDVVDRDTVVLVISDGLEVGEIDILEDGMAWLSQRADVVLWLNPLAASPEYEPVCRGMETALPYIDGLFAFTQSGDLTEIARQLDRYGPGGAIGYEQDLRRREEAASAKK